MDGAAATAIMVATGFGASLQGGALLPTVIGAALSAVHADRVAAHAVMPAARAERVAAHAVMPVVHEAALVAAMRAASVAVAMQVVAVDTAAADIGKNCDFPQKGSSASAGEPFSAGWKCRTSEEPRPSITRFRAPDDEWTPRE